MVIVPSLASTAIGSCILCLFVGILIGLLCGKKCMHKQTTRRNHSIPDSPGRRAEEATAVPFYEDVELRSDMNVIELSHNIAYEQCIKISN